MTINSEIPSVHPTCRTNGTCAYGKGKVTITTMRICSVFHLICLMVGLALFVCLLVHLGNVYLRTQKLNRIHSYLDDVKELFTEMEQVDEDMERVNSRFSLLKVLVNRVHPNSQHSS